MNNVLLVFIGGGLGSLARYGVGRVITSLWVLNFPFATLISNTVSSFMLGLIVGLSLERVTITDNVKLFLIVGFCGGFSTFSSFSYETLDLMRNGQTFMALANVLMNVLLCTVCIWGGMTIARLI